MYVCTYVVIYIATCIVIYNYVYIRYSFAYTDRYIVYLNWVCLGDIAMLAHIIYLIILTIMMSLPHMGVP